MTSIRVQAITLVLACLATAILAGCSQAKLPPSASETQPEFSQQQTKATADYIAYIKAHGKTGQ